MHFFTLKNSAILSTTTILYLIGSTNTAQANNVVKTVSNGALTFELEFEDELQLTHGMAGRWCGVMPYNNLISMPPTSG